MAFELPNLPYAYDALEPVISKQTLEFHHDKHHAAYVNNLNNLIKGTEFENADIVDIIMKSEGGIFNNAAQTWNHTFYFDQFGQDKSSEPKGQLKDALEATYGSFDDFKEKFSAAAKTLFGSGWAWLVKKPNGSLDIVQTVNAANPLTEGLIPILTCDVWEHAYYLDYQNKRPDYIESFWKILDWEVISGRY
ncbi:MAG: superoxide dismutase [Bacteroidales bacterium]|jgi:Fe-Mn family superoxide dismutase|nr:superoxide dismutase [Bacteroidales bacterium]